MPRQPHPSRKSFTRFSSRLPFQFGLPNVSPSLGQASDDSPVYFTRATSLLRQQVLAKASGVKIKSDSYRMQVVPRDGWREPDLTKESILFLIPDDALGDCVGMTLFLKALRLRFPNVRIGVLNSGSASDIFALIPDIEIFQLFMSSKQFVRFDHVIDLSEMEGWKDIATMPVNPEEALCEAFGIDPCPLEERKPLAKAGMRIGIVPMASSPLRTLPPKLVQTFVKTLAKQDVHITIVLNAYQGVMKAYKAALGDLCGENIKLVDGFKTIGDLVRFVREQDYIIAADSGPAHISKLFQTPGLGIYSSASAATLQGRHKNLKTWQSSFKGTYCEAPCGLAKLRTTSDGQIGCMESLNVPINDLIQVPASSNLAKAKELVTRNPVPCVAHLAGDEAMIVEAILKDLGFAFTP